MEDLGTRTPRSQQSSTVASLAPRACEEEARFLSSALPRSGVDKGRRLPSSSRRHDVPDAPSVKSQTNYNIQQQLIANQQQLFTSFASLQQQVTLLVQQLASTPRGIAAPKAYTAPTDKANQPSGTAAPDATLMAAVDALLDEPALRWSSSSTTNATSSSDVHPTQAPTLPIAMGQGITPTANAGRVHLHIAPPGEAPKKPKFDGGLADFASRVEFERLYRSYQRATKNSRDAGQQYRLLPPHELLTEEQQRRLASYHLALEDGSFLGIDANHSNWAAEFNGISHRVDNYLLLRGGYDIRSESTVDAALSVVKCSLQDTHHATVVSLYEALTDAVAVTLGGAQPAPRTFCKAFMDKIRPARLKGWVVDQVKGRGTHSHLRYQPFALAHFAMQRAKMLDQAWGRPPSEADDTPAKGSASSGADGESSCDDTPAMGSASDTDYDSGGDETDV